MASLSPTESVDTNEDGNQGSEAAYIEGWQDISRLMDSGSSWSGNERNCAFLNLGQSQFVDVSAAAGLDYIQDGRAVANLDWDGDGDLDLWLKSRNGRQLRLLENNRAVDQGFVGVRLQGTTCNRDAIGARVVIRAAGKSYSQELRCGEGYLAQSSDELLFGLKGAARLDEVLVHWPGGGQESFTGLTLGAHVRLVQGAGTAQVLAARQVKLEELAELPQLPQLPRSSRVVLRTPLPLPTALQRDCFDSNKPGARLINLWATWCEPCVGELGELATRYKELASVGLEILPMCLDGVDEPNAASTLFAQRIAPQFAAGAAFGSRNLDRQERDFFEVLFAHFIAKPGALPVPTSFLVDKNGFIQVLYIGPLDVDGLLADVATYGLEPSTVGVRCQYPGRWFYGMPRNMEQLAVDLRNRGLNASASYYAALHTLAHRRPQ